MAKYTLSKLFNGDFPITQRYNENPDNYPMFAIPGHEGIDYGTPNGTPVLAPFDGIILRDTFADKDYGNFTVCWDSVQLCAVWYCHLQDVTTVTGDRVTKGQVIGHTNNTGHSTGSHLHVNFVETDALGNRLNTDNGKQGFLDLLNPDLVSFETPAPPDNGTIPEMPNYFVNLLTDNHLDLTNEGQIRTFFGDAKDAPGLRTDKENLTTNLSNAMKANDEQATLIADLRKQLQNALQEVGTAPNSALGKFFYAIAKSFG